MRRSGRASIALARRRYPSAGVGSAGGRAGFECAVLPLADAKARRPAVAGPACAGGARSFSGWCFPARGVLRRARGA
eukprot:11157821-Lingulodinium_polyedra.AAC.1